MRKGWLEAPNVLAQGTRTEFLVCANLRATAAHIVSNEQAVEVLFKRVGYQKRALSKATENAVTNQTTGTRNEPQGTKLWVPQSNI